MDYILQRKVYSGWILLKIFFTRDFWYFSNTVLNFQFQVKGVLKKTHRDYFKSYQVIFDNDHHFDSDMMSQQSYDSYVK